LSACLVKGKLEGKTAEQALHFCAAVLP
jgi:hypothetical protein